MQTNKWKNTQFSYTFLYTVTNTQCSRHTFNQTQVNEKTYNCLHRHRELPIYTPKTELSISHIENNLRRTQFLRNHIQALHANKFTVYKYSQMLSHKPAQKKQTFNKYTHVTSYLYNHKCRRSHPHDLNFNLSNTNIRSKRNLFAQLSFLCSQFFAGWYLI